MPAENRLHNLRLLHAAGFLLCVTLVATAFVVISYVEAAVSYAGAERLGADRQAQLLRCHRRRLPACQSQPQGPQGVARLRLCGLGLQDGRVL